jgi:hypothetical protein
MPSGTSPSDPSLLLTPTDALASAATWSARLRAAADDARHVAVMLVSARDDARLTGPAGAALTELVQGVAHAVQGLSATCDTTADELAALTAAAAPAVRVLP